MNWKVRLRENKPSVNIIRMNFERISVEAV